MIDFYCWQGPKGSKYCVDHPIIDQIMWYAQGDAELDYKPYPRRHSIKGLYGAEGEEIYETAYWAWQGCPEDTELLASKWMYKFDKFGKPTKIEME